jgi:hypothetical protein
VLHACRRRIERVGCIGVKKLPLVLLLLSGAVLASACGVDYGDAKEGNEFFKSAKVSGDFRAGIPLTGVDVQIKCEIRQGKTLVQALDSHMVPALANGGSKATPVPGSFSYDFTVAAAGAYKFECFTAVDEDNYIIRDFTVRAAPAGAHAAATPTPAAP